jgi:ATP-dependent Clp protease ATP-binding subunit ClpB
MTLELTEPARVLIAREGYDPVYGARPLRRFISHEVETRIGRALLTGEIIDGATITLDAEGDELVVRWRNPDRGGADREAEAPVGAAA